MLKQDERNLSNAAMVINAAAYTDVDRAESEPEIAFMANRDGPANLAVACAGAGIPLVHISTDYFAHCLGLWESRS